MNGLPLDLWHWGLATVPLIVLLVLLVGLRSVSYTHLTLPTN